MSQDGGRFQGPPRLPKAFSMTALQMLRRDLLDVPLFMNTFAKKFLGVIEAMRTVNAEIHAAPDANVARLNDFERMCEQWRLRDPAQSEQSNQKPGRPTAFDVYFNDRTQEQAVPLDEYPYILQMPVLDGPGMLAGRRVSPREFPDLLESGRLWTWAAPEDEERAKALLEKYGTANIAATQRIYLTDF
jgi:hypothetical protein